MMKIIDIHTHLLYRIDDGASSREMSMQLIGMEFEQGVRGIFCTNHSGGMEWKHKDYHRRFETLQKLTADQYPEVSLYKGCEVMCYRDEMPDIMKNLKRGIFPTMNGTSYVLTEFDPGWCDGTEEMRYCLSTILDAGYIPIIAHTERYANMYGTDPVEDLRKMKDEGCLVQVNLFSVEQDQGKREELANVFLQNRLVDFVGTDTHNLTYKSPEARIGADSILKRLDLEYAAKVLHKNAEEILKVS